MKNKVKTQTAGILKRLCRCIPAGALTLTCAAGLFADLPASADTITVIPSDAVEFDGHYYALRDDLQAMGNASWETADRLCKAAGGHLAVINTTKESDYLAQLVRESEYNAAFFGAYLEGSEWKWCTGEDFIFTNWAESAHDGSPYGLFMNNDADGLWHSSRFGASGTAYICEWDEGTPCTMQQQNHIHSDLIHMNHKWYQFYDAGLTQEDAEAFCLAQGGRLAYIDSEELQTQIMETLEAHGTKTMYWIGGMQIADWVWFDGTEEHQMEYTNWADGEPSNASGTAVYAALNLNSERFARGCWVAESASGSVNHETEYYPNFGLICEWDTECSADGIEYPWHEGEWVEVAEANCTQEGESNFICKHCGEVLQNNVYPKGDHQFEQTRIFQKFSFDPVPGFLRYQCKVCGTTKYDLEPKGLVLDGTLLGLVLVAILAFFSAKRDYNRLKGGTSKF